MTQRKHRAGRTGTGQTAIPRPRIDLDKYCEIYLTTGCKVGAYRDAMSGAPHSRNLDQLADKFYNTRRVQRRLGELAVEVCDKLARRDNITSSRIKERLSTIAFSSIEDVCEFDGARLMVKPFSTMTKGQLAAIKSIKQDKDGDFKVELHDPVRALEVLGKILGILSDVVNNTVVVDMRYSRTRREPTVIESGF